MSWSVSHNQVPGDSVADQLAADFDAAYPDPGPGVRDQFDAALEEAASLVASGIVGDGPYTISLSGHVQGDGGSADAVGVYVTGTPG